jgi:hypothetical protein
MSELNKEKLLAAAKIGIGMARMASAVATASGVGVVGGFLRHHGMTRAATPLARRAFLGGKDMFVQGLTDWKAAK